MRDVSISVVEQLFPEHVVNFVESVARMFCREGELNIRLRDA